jgi:pyruvate/2-oxoglutarate dehydrogenase complex dihydrolipoamide dehydrogenase (E3) component
MAENYDAIVIGAGQAGGPLAGAFAKAGRKTALVERKHVGGTCINEGCTPTKTMVASARVAYLARRGADYGVHTGPVSVDMVRVRQRKRDIVDSFRGGSERGLASAGVEVVRGEGFFTGPHTVEVRQEGSGSRTLAAPLVVINAGARPARPPLEGLETVPALDSTSIMELDAVPEHLLVLGGGYIGLEFGQMFRRFGSRVTVVQRDKQLLGREDADVAELLAQILREDGLEILLSSEALRVRRAAGGIELVARSAGGERVLTGSHLLLAPGRVPNTDVLNLPAAGVTMDPRGFVRVNERLETSVPGVYAVGDVKGGPAFTHISYDDYRVLRANLLGKGDGKATTTKRLVPYTVFTDPQLARVGMSEEEARRQGLNVRVARMPMSYVARALEMDESRGMMKGIVGPDDQILGFTVLGIEGGELMAAVEMAMLGRLPYTTLRDAVFAHPTLAESLNNLFATLSN